MARAGIEVRGRVAATAQTRRAKVEWLNCLSQPRVAMPWPPFVLGPVGRCVQAVRGLLRDVDDVGHGALRGGGL